MSGKPIDEAVRAKFEAWAQSQGRSTNTWVETGEYTHYDTQRCWEAWQAALTAAQQQQGGGETIAGKFDREVLNPMRVADHRTAPPSTPAAVDGAMEWTDEAAYAFRKEVDAVGAHWHPWPVRFRFGMRAALAAQHQEPTTCNHVFRRDEDNGGNCCQLCDEVKP